MNQEYRRKVVEGLKSLIEESLDKILSRDALVSDSEIDRQFDDVRNLLDVAENLRYFPEREVEALFRKYNNCEEKVYAEVLKTH